MGSILAQGAEQVGWVVTLLDRWGFPVAMLAICIFALWKISQKQDARYDAMIGQYNRLENEFREVLRTQIAESNLCMGKLDAHMERQCSNSDRQSALLEKLIDSFDRNQKP